MQAGPRERVFEVGLDEIEIVSFDEIRLRDDDDAGGDIEEIEDGEVLAGLGHGAFVGGDDEEGEIDATGASEHVLDKAFVAGDIDDADFAARRQREPGEPEVDGEAALLLLAQAIGIDARDGADKGALTVVDVAGGADDMHGGIPSA